MYGILFTALLVIAVPFEVPASEELTAIRNAPQSPNSVNCAAGIHAPDLTLCQLSLSQDYNIGDTRKRRKIAEITFYGNVNNSNILGNSPGLVISVNQTAPQITLKVTEITCGNAGTFVCETVWIRADDKPAKCREGFGTEPAVQSGLVRQNHNTRVEVEPGQVNMTSFSPSPEDPVAVVLNCSVLTSRQVEWVWERQEPGRQWHRVGGDASGVPGGRAPLPESSCWLHHSVLKPPGLTGGQSNYVIRCYVIADSKPYLAQAAYFSLPPPSGNKAQVENHAGNDEASFLTNGGLGIILVAITGVALFVILVLLLQLQRQGSFQRLRVWSRRPNGRGGGRGGISSAFGGALTKGGHPDAESRGPESKEVKGQAGGRVQEVNPTSAFLSELNSVVKLHGGRGGKDKKGGRRWRLGRRKKRTEASGAGDVDGSQGVVDDEATGNDNNNDGSPGSRDRRPQSLASARRTSLAQSKDSLLHLDSVIRQISAQAELATARLLTTQAALSQEARRPAKGPPAVRSTRSSTLRAQWLSRLGGEEESDGAASSVHSLGSGVARKKKKGGAYRQRSVEKGGGSGSSSAGSLRCLSLLGDQDKEWSGRGRGDLDTSHLALSGTTQPPKPSRIAELIKESFGSSMQLGYFKGNKSANRSEAEDKEDVSAQVTSPKCRLSGRCPAQLECTQESQQGTGPLACHQAAQPPQAAEGVQSVHSSGSLRSGKFLHFPGRLLSAKKADAAKGLLTTPPLLDAEKAGEDFSRSLSLKRCPEKTDLVRTAEIQQMGFSGSPNMAKFFTAAKESTLPKQTEAQHKDFSLSLNQQTTKNISPRRKQSSKKAEGQHTDSLLSQNHPYTIASPTGNQPSNKMEIREASLPSHNHTNAIISLTQTQPNRMQQRDSLVYQPLPQTITSSHRPSNKPEAVQRNALEFQHQLPTVAPRNQTSNKPEAVQRDTSASQNQLHITKRIQHSNKMDIQQNSSEFQNRQQSISSPTMMETVQKDSLASQPKTHLPQNKLEAHQRDSLASQNQPIFESPPARRKHLSNKIEELQKYILGSQAQSVKSSTKNKSDTAKSKRKHSVKTESGEKVNFESLQLKNAFIVSKRDSPLKTLENVETSCPSTLGSASPERSPTDKQRLSFPETARKVLAGFRKSSSSSSQDLPMTRSGNDIPGLVNSRRLSPGKPQAVQRIRSGSRSASLPEVIVKPDPGSKANLASSDCAVEGRGDEQTVVLSPDSESAAVTRIPSRLKRPTSRGQDSRVAGRTSSIPRLDSGHLNASSTGRKLSPLAQDPLYFRFSQTADVSESNTTSPEESQSRTEALVKQEGVGGARSNAASSAARESASPDKSLGVKVSTEEPQTPLPVLSLSQAATGAGSSDWSLNVSLASSHSGLGSTCSSAMYRSPQVTGRPERLEIITSPRETSGAKAISPLERLEIITSPRDTSGGKATSPTERSKIITSPRDSSEKVTSPPDSSRVASSPLERCRIVTNPECRPAKPPRHGATEASPRCEDDDGLSSFEALEKRILLEERAEDGEGEGGAEPASQPHAERGPGSQQEATGAAVLGPGFSHADRGISTKSPPKLSTQPSSAHTGVSGGSDAEVVSSASADNLASSAIAGKQ